VIALGIAAIGDSPCQSQHSGFFTGNVTLNLAARALTPILN